MTIIEWYEQICKDDSFNDIQTLMQKRGQLSAASVTLAKEIKDKSIAIRREQFNAELAKKRRIIHLHTTIDPNTNKPYTSAKASIMADVEYDTDLEWVEVEEASLDGDKIVLRQINQVLEAMKQDIAEMRALREGKQT